MHLKADGLPFATATNTFIEVLHALLNITFEHIILVDLSSASLDDLVADLGEKSLHSLRGVVELTHLPDKSDTVKHFRENLRDVFRLSSFNLSAWLSQSVEELKVIIGLFMTSFDLLLKLLESWKIRTTSDVKDIDNPLKLSLLKLNVKDIKISCSASPVLNLIKRAGALSTLLRILITSHFFDLSGPVDYCGF